MIGPKVILAATAALLITLCASAREMRTWTAEDGRTIEAEFLSRDGDTVTIRRSDSRVFTLAIDRLSPEDRDYARAREAASFPAFDPHRSPSGEQIDALLRYGAEEGWDSAAERLRSKLLAAYGSRASQLDEWYTLYRWLDLFQDQPFHRELATGSEPFGHGWPDSLRRFVLENRDFSREFFGLISPGDRTGEVSRILQQLYENDAGNFRNYSSLALAIAVVYDQEPPRRWPHRQVSQDLLPRRLPEPEEAFEFFVDSHRTGRLLINPQRLRAEELRFTVDILAPLEELKWAQQQVRQGLSRFDQVYYAVEYDDSRYGRDVETIQYHWEHEDYRLSTIREKGGICVDQAYFATQAGKARGLPTLYFLGTGNDAGHAWFGYLRGTSGGWNLDVGRYFMQGNYVTGHALDPQTWEPVRDHDIAYLEERFHNSRNYRDSLFHSDFAREFRIKGDSEKALSFARRALEIEARNRDAWTVVLEILEGRKDVAAHETALREAADAFSRYPDLEAYYIGELAESLISRNERDKAYEELRRISRKNRSDRPDISLSMAAVFLEFSLTHDNGDEQLAIYRNLLSELGNHAPGMGFYRELGQPFFTHLVRSGRSDEARRMIRQTHRRLNPGEGTPLDRELTEIASRIR